MFRYIVNACVKGPFLTSIHCTRPWLSVATSSKLIIPQATAKQCKPHSREYHDKNRDAQRVKANTGSAKLIIGTLDVVSINSINLVFVDLSKSQSLMEVAIILNFYPVIVGKDNLVVIALG